MTENQTVLKTHNRWEQIVFWGIAALLVFAPLSFGAVHVWAYSILEIGVFFLVILYVIGKIAVSGNTEFCWIRTPVNILLICLILLIVLQMIPLPCSWISFISPETYRDKMKLSELTAEANGGWICLAYYLHPLITEGLKLFAYIAMFFLVIHTVRSKRQIDILMYLLIFIGLFEAIYAIYETFSVMPKIWWWKSRVGGARYASGTFIVSNHFAFYMEMILGMTFGFMIAQKKRQKRLIPGLYGFRASFQRWISSFSPESARPKVIFFFFSAVIMGLALLLSASRGGILSISAAMLLMTILFFTKKRYRKYGAMTLCLCLLAMIYGLHVGMDPTLKKFGRTEGLDLRLYTTRTIFPMIHDYPLLGVGWGNFRYVYPRYIPKDAPAGFDGVDAAGYSHNDWIEAGAEIGWLGEGLLFLMFMTYLYRMIRVWYIRRDAHASGIGAGAIAALLSVGFHSYFDFSMHIPANPLTLAAVLGIAYVAVHRKGHGYDESFFYRVRKIPLTLSRRILLTTLSLFFIFTCTFTAGRHFFAEMTCPTEWNSTLNLNREPFLTDMQKAVSINPLNAEYHCKAAELLMKDNILREEYNEPAISSLQKAVQLNPAKGAYWCKLGERYASKRYDAYYYVEKWLPLADQCFDEAIRCEPSNDNMLFRVALYWVWRSRLSSDEMKEEGIQKFQTLFQRSLNIKPKPWKQAAERVWEYYPDDSVLIGIVPPNNEEMMSLVLEWSAEKLRQ